jgi:hypothetical protein
LKYRSLAFVPFGFAIVFAGAALGLGDRLPVALGVENETGKVLALAGCLAAALAFERGDYLRRAWLTLGGCYLLLLLNDGLGASGSVAPQLQLVRGLIVAVANGCAVVGIWMLAQAWSVAGLEDDDDALRRRRAMFLGALVLSLGICGWPLVHDVLDLAGGERMALVSVASDLGDAISLILVAPVMHTALAMRGGVLRWPWGFLTASGLAWLAYDVSSGVVEALHVGPGIVLMASEALRALANGYICAAGVAQRMTVAPNVRLSMPPAA